MPKPYPIELRQRVVDHVELGHTHRGTARHFKVSIKFVNDMVKLHKETGALAPKAYKGRLGKGKLAPYKDWLIERVHNNPSLTLNELRQDLFKHFGVQVNLSPIYYHLRNRNYTHKKRQYFLKSSNEQT